MFCRFIQSFLRKDVLQIYAEHFTQRNEEIIVKSFVQSNGVVDILIIYNQNNNQIIFSKN